MAVGLRQLRDIVVLQKGGRHLQRQAGREPRRSPLEAGGVDRGGAVRLNGQARGVRLAARPRQGLQASEARQQQDADDRGRGHPEARSRDGEQTRASEAYEHGRPSQLEAGELPFAA